MNYEYRIIKYEEGDEVYFCIEECGIDEDGVLLNHTIEYTPKCTSITEIKDTLEEMKQSLTKPILGSFPSVSKEGCCNEHMI